MDERKIYCIGSVLWDIIGRASGPMSAGDDIGGTITRLPGGVALNIAMNLRNLNIPVGLISVLGKDAEGNELLRALARYQFDLAHVLRHDTLPTDAYMAIETSKGPLAAIADANSLEKAGDEILAPFADSRLGSFDDPYFGDLVVDGNLTEDVLTYISQNPLFKCASIWVAPASPGKAVRLRSFLGQKNTTMFVNRHEAELILKTKFKDSQAASQAMFDSGLKRAVVTDSANAATVTTKQKSFSETPPDVRIKRFTGAGDSFMAAFIAAISAQADEKVALKSAVLHTAKYISADENVFAI